MSDAQVAGKIAAETLRELAERMDRAEVKARRLAASPENVGSPSSVAYMNGAADTYQALARAMRDEIARYEEGTDG